MKLPRWLDIICLGLFAVACLPLTGCGKKTPLQQAEASPPTAKQAELARQSRLDWNLDTTVGAYEKAGNTGAGWNEPAKRALTEFAGSRSQTLPPDEDSTQIIRDGCRSAVEAGCQDPLIRYLYIRYCMDQTNTPQDFARAFYEMSSDMQKSSYPSVRKFYASLRALDQIFYAYPTNFESAPGFQEIQSSIGKNVMDTIQDNTTPPEEAYEVSQESLKGFASDSSKYAQAYGAIYLADFTVRPNAATTWLLKGEANLQMAWMARGGGYADTVTKDGWKSFTEKLAVAEAALQTAWKLDPKDGRIPTAMIKVVGPQGKKQGEMETWFGRAMALNPDNYEACQYKLLYVAPRWGGSRAAMIAFGRECVASKKWGGTVPLILVDAHSDYATFALASEEARLAYWKQPDVWPDIKAAYDRVFALNPKATYLYKNYAWYAYHADQWDTFNELAPEVRSGDYNFFGGKDKFDQMVQTAKEHAK